uniref:Uncharacterized protein n=1 Tax=viral metagenome TaxID=1070528 RepID=A0A6C0AW56_9ZZZZ
MIIIEFLSWILYIVIILLIMIKIKPSYASLFVFFVYVYYSTYKYPDLCECVMFYNIPVIIQHGLILSYSILCTIAYYIVYYLYHNYNYRLTILLLIPLFYFIQLYIGHIIYGCKETFFIELYNLDKEDGEFYNNIN